MCQFDLGKVPRPQFRLELVEADPLAQCELLLHALVVLLLPLETLVEGVDVLGRDIPGVRDDPGARVGGEGRVPRVVRVLCGPDSRFGWKEKGQRN